MEKPKPHETELKAAWATNQGKIRLDEVGERIEWLIQNYFVKIGTINSGWDTVFQDPDDDRYWELIYPQSHLQDGGPALLRCIRAENVNDILKEIAKTRADDHEK